MSENALLNRYAHIVDAALRGVLTGDERPLIVATSEPLASIYRAVSSYPHTSQTVIGGNADRTPEHELAKSAREILDAVNAERLTSLVHPEQ